jgi:hypothetical protein
MMRLRMLKTSFASLAVLCVCVTADPATSLASPVGKPSQASRVTCRTVVRQGHKQKICRRPAPRKPSKPKASVKTGAAARPSQSIAPPAPSAPPSPSPFAAPAAPAAPAGTASSGSAVANDAESVSTEAVTTAPWPGGPFSPTSVWNTPLPADAAVDPNSQAYVNELVRQVQSYGPWMNTTSYSTPVYVVAANQATQHVTLDTWGPDLQAAFDAVPIPANAQAASGTDEHMVIWQPSTDKMWEFWLMHQQANGWHARWGGEMDDVSTNPGYFTHTGLTNNWGATATGLPLLGGLVSQADLQRGHIDHALAISLVEAQPATWSWPAQRTDGGDFTPNITPIPEGTRFRLDPTLNIPSLHLPALDRMIAQAAQTYGIIVRDKAGAVSFYGQDPKTMATNPWPQAFSNQYPNTYLSWLPWNHMQAVATQASCCWSH